MNMNISANSFGANLTASRIKVVGKVDGYVEEMLNRGNQIINDAANLHKRDVTIAQRGDVLMVNSGVITSMFNMKDMKSGRDFFLNTISNIRANSIVPKQGLNKAFNTLA